jgi:hypothetical protein
MSESKKRRRSELDSLANKNYLSERYTDESSTQHCYLEGSLAKHVSHIPVTDMITHMFSELDRLYPGEDAMIWHDALSQLADKSTQAWLKTQGNWWGRFIRCEEANKDTRYEFSLCGNSPELMKGLDWHGFADFIQSTHHHVSLTSIYEMDDPDRMFDGTPKQLEATMKKCWTMEPTSERITEDILGLKDTLLKIIAADGCLVKDEDVRSGRRQQKLNGDGECKGKTRKSQRISTLKERPTHPSALRALQLIEQEAEAEFERLNPARLEHELLAFVVEEEVEVREEEEEVVEEELYGDFLALDPDSDEEIEIEEE